MSECRDSLLSLHKFCNLQRHTWLVTKHVLHQSLACSACNINHSHTRHTAALRSATKGQLAEVSYSRSSAESQGQTLQVKARIPGSVTYHKGHQFTISFLRPATQPHLLMNLVKTHHHAKNTLYVHKFPARHRAADKLHL